MWNVQLLLFLSCIYSVICVRIEWNTAESICNLHSCYTFCTGVTEELHSFLSQSELSNFFVYIIKGLISWCNSALRIAQGYSWRWQLSEISFLLNSIACHVKEFYWKCHTHLMTLHTITLSVAASDFLINDASLISYLLYKGVLSF